MFTPQPPRHIPTLPTASVEQSRHVGFTPDSGRTAATQLIDASGQHENSKAAGEAPALLSILREPPGKLAVEDVVIDPVLAKQIGETLAVVALH